ncbi:hypothetical protein [Rubripirellula lacrimiformis]|nr:hypothetical protein [Rubripirellula lacrimiformis]
MNADAVQVTKLTSRRFTWMNALLMDHPAICMETTKRVVVAGAIALGASWAGLVHADQPRPIQQFGRWSGAGWGDGYHACKESSGCLTADLPPGSFATTFGDHQNHGCADGCGPILNPRTLYDRFDAGQAVHCDSVASGCDAATCDAIGSIPNGWEPSIAAPTNHHHAAQNDAYGATIIDPIANRHGSVPAPARATAPAHAPNQPGVPYRSTSNASAAMLPTNSADRLIHDLQDRSPRAPTVHSQLAAPILQAPILSAPLREALQAADRSQAAAKPSPIRPTIGTPVAQYASTMQTPSTAQGRMIAVPVSVTTSRMPTPIAPIHPAATPAATPTTEIAMAPAASPSPRPSRLPATGRNADSASHASPPQASIDAPMQLMAPAGFSQPEDPFGRSTKNPFFQAN